MGTKSISNGVPRPARVAFVCAMVGLAMALALSPVVLAGGFQLSVEAAASNNPQLKGAALVVRTYGCMQPADAVVKASAEGLVGGKRQTIQLELAQLETGAYMLKQQWPSEGFWVIAINGEYKGMTNSLLVELGPNGKVHPDTKLVEGSRKGSHVRGSARKWAASDIQSTLEALAANKSTVSEDASEVMPAGSRPATWVVAGLGAFLFLVGFVTLTRRARHGSR